MLCLIFAATRFFARFNISWNWDILNYNNLYKGLVILIKMGEEKSYERQCQSYVRDGNGNLLRCNSRGERREDKGLDSGIHCDSCWREMIADCRSRSW